MVSRENIAAAIKEYRLERELSLKKLAEKIGISVVGLWNIETGKHKPSELTMYRIRKNLPDLFVCQKSA